MSKPTPFQRAVKIIQQQTYAAAGETFTCATTVSGGSYSIELAEIPGQHLIGGTLADNNATRLGRQTHSDLEACGARAAAAERER